MAVSLPRDGGPPAVTWADRVGMHRSCRCGASVGTPPLGGSWSVAPEGGAPDGVRCRAAATCSARDGASTGEPGFLCVLGTSEPFGVEVDEVVSGEVGEVRTAGQVNDVAHCGSFACGRGPRRGERGPGAGRRSADRPHGDRRNGVGRSARWSVSAGRWSGHAAGGGVRCVCRSPPLRPWITAARARRRGVAMSSWRGFGAWCPPGVGGGRSHSGGASIAFSCFFKLGITYSGFGFRATKRATSRSPSRSLVTCGTGLPRAPHCEGRSHRARASVKPAQLGGAGHEVDVERVIHGLGRAR